MKILIKVAAFIDPPPIPDLTGIFFLTVTRYFFFNNFFLSKTDKVL